MRWLLILISLIAKAQSFTVIPLTLHQGETFKVTGSKDSATALLQGVMVRLYPGETGKSFALLPTKISQVPGSYPVEFLDRSGAILHTVTVTIKDAHYPKQNVVLSKEVAELKPSTNENALVRAFHDQVSDNRYWAEPLQAPIPGCLTSLFGVQRYQNGIATGDAHGGLDQRGAAGTPVHAVAAGIVKISQPFQLRGGTVAIDHGQAFASMYLHMSKVTAKEGSLVAAGDIVGYVGSTGRSTAPHLHWSLYVSGFTVTPLQWVALKPCAVPVKKPARRLPSKPA